MAHRQEQGAAVVMALFIVVLCVLATTPLVWALFATSKTISVSNARAQSHQIVLSGLDWARIILREDARISTTDNLTEPWAVPLADSQISESLMRDGDNNSNLDDREAVLYGQIEDAQGRFNLRNLVVGSDQQEQWQNAFGRLCQLLGIPQSQKEAIEQALLLMYPDLEAIEGNNNEQANDDQFFSTIVEQKVPAITWEEFRTDYGLTGTTWAQLQPHVVMLTRTTPVNVNTASAEVLYAVVEGLDYGGAQAAVNYRERVTFNSLNDLRAVWGAQVTLNSDFIGVSSDFFRVGGQVQLGQAVSSVNAILERKDGKVFVVWRQD